MKSSWRTFAPLLVWLVIYLVPVPSGLNANQWHYFAVFAAVITGLILESMPVGAVGLIGLTVAGVGGYVEPDPNKSLRWMLSGFSESTVWLIVGAFVVANQGKTLKAVKAALPTLFKGSPYTKARYMELMALLYDILQKARKEGLMSIEKDVEDPGNSPLFKKYATVGTDHHVVEFVTDYLRMMVSGNLNAHEIESLMDNEIETHHNEGHTPVNAIKALAGALPAFGIVAAVLGVTLGVSGGL